MSFFKQIRLEAVNLLRSKFILIFAAVVLAASVLVPVIGLFTQSKNDSYDGVIMYETDAKAYTTANTTTDFVIPNKEYEYDDPIEIGGVTLNSDSPFYSTVFYMLNERTSYEQESTDTAQLTVQLIDKLLEMYAKFARSITTYNDYRYQLCWECETKICERFGYAYEGSNWEPLRLALQYRYWLEEADFNAKFVNITAQQRIDGIDKLDKYTARVDKVLEGDFEAYIDLMIEQQNNQIADFEKNIEELERAIIDNPANEAAYAERIDSLKTGISNIKNTTIPILEYRLANNIIPNTDTWQNKALDEITSCSDELSYTKPVTEKEFLKSQWMIQQYGNYEAYTASINKRIDTLNNNIIIARRSVDSGNPDMKFVPEGSRSATVSFLYYSIIVTMLAIVIGGWAIASEFQSGTVRLLLIRPRTRSKVLLSKYFAAMFICLAIYICGCLLNLLMNGFIRGFEDFSYLNYTVTGSVGFLGYYLPKMLCCIFSIIAGLSFAFMLSTVVRNTAVAISLPIIIYVASFIVNSLSPYSGNMGWVVYTPFPYLDISAFFIKGSSVMNMIEYGMNLSIVTAIIVLTAVTAASVGCSLAVFNKRDVTN